MSGMNPWLAQIYGTDGGEDIEKTAQTHLLSKLAEENNLDLSQFSPEELQQLLQEVMGEQVMQQGQQAGAVDQNPTQMGGQAPMGAAPQHPAMAQAFAPAAQPQVPPGMPAGAMQAPPQDPAAMQKEAQAKFEEADLLGRVMAHAYTQELEKIAASAGALGSGSRFRAAADKVKSHVSGHAKGVAQMGRKAVKENPGAAKAVAGGAIAAGGFAAGRASKKEKTASAGPAFLKLAEMHAADILSSAGFDPQTGADTYAQQEQSQQAAPEQAPQQEAAPQEGQPEAGAEFAQQLDQTALDMLANAGYDVNEILARLQFSQNNQGQA